MVIEHVPLAGPSTFIRDHSEVVVFPWWDRPCFLDAFGRLAACADRRERQWGGFVEDTVGRRPPVEVVVGDGVGSR